MTRYRKKPVVVDAKQWTGDNLDEIAEFVGPIDPPLMDEEDGGIVWIWVNEYAERQAVVAGDWVVADPDGIGYHQCSAIEFDASFEESSSALLRRDQVDELDAMWAAVCSNEAQPEGPGTKVLLQSVLDALPALIETARAASS